MKIYWMIFVKRSYVMRMYKVNRKVLKYEYKNI